jgi:hypothetical protein
MQEYLKAPSIGVVVNRSPQKSSVFEPKQAILGEFLTEKRSNQAASIDDICRWSRLLPALPSRARPPRMIAAPNTVASSNE